MAEQLWQCLAATLAPDRPTRTAAEEHLSATQASTPDFCMQLLLFSLDSGAAPAGAPVSDEHVRLAAATRAKNVVQAADWSKTAHFSEAAREQAKATLVDALCTRAFPGPLRAMLLHALSLMHGYDWAAGRWAQLVPATLQLLQSGCTRVSRVLEGGAVDEEAAAALQSVATALTLLKWCAKVVADVISVAASDFEDHANTVAGPLAAAATLLTGASACGLEQRLSASLSFVAAPPPSVARSVLHNLEESQYAVLKCVWHLGSARTPAALSTIEACDGWSQCAIAVAQSAFAQLAAWRAASGAVPEHVFDNCLATTRVHFWKKLKRATALLHRWFQRFLLREVGAKSKASGKRFVEVWAPQVVEVALAVAWWHHNAPADADPFAAAGSALHLPVVNAAAGEPLCSKALIFCIEIVSVAMGCRPVYEARLRPLAAVLLTNVLFRRLCLTAEDRELFDTNPEEYVRRLSDPKQDLYSPRMVSMVLVREMCVPSKKFHGAGLMAEFGAHLQQVMAAAVQDGAADPNGYHAAALDACLHCVTALRSALVEWPLEYVMATYVVPLMRHSVPFLRARAISTAGVFAARVEWKEAATFEAMVHNAVALLQDTELPVRIQASISLSKIIRHNLARPVVEPRVAEVVQRYFGVMSGFTHEGIVRTLRNIIRFYASTLSQWAVPLCDMLVQHFTTLHTGLAAREAGDGPSQEEEDNVADLSLAADELLATLTTLMRAIPGGEETKPLFIQLQGAVSPVLYRLLSSDNTMGFLDPALRLLAMLISRSPSVAPDTWSVFACFRRLVVSGNALDYFPEFLVPIDNFLSVDPHTFVSASVAGGESPAQHVLDMAHAVLTAPHLRAMERAAALSVLDTVCLNARRVEDPALRQAFAAAYVPKVLALSAQFMEARRQSGAPTPPGMWVLLSNVFFAALLLALSASPASAVLATLRGQTGYVLGSYCQLVAQRPCPVKLRVYDRKLFAAALTTLCDGLLAEDPAQAAPALESVAGEGLPQWLTLALQQLQDTAAVEAAALRRDVAQRGATVDAADGWEDDESDSDGDGTDTDAATDSDDDINLGSGGLDSDDLYDDGDSDGDIADDDHFAETVAAARQLAQRQEAEEDDPDEDLLADADFESPLDAHDEFAAFTALCQRCATAQGAVGAALWAQCFGAPWAQGAVSNAAPEKQRALRRGKARPRVVVAYRGSGEEIPREATFTVAEFLGAASQQRAAVVTRGIKAKR